MRGAGSQEFAAGGKSGGVQAGNGGAIRLDNGTIVFSFDTANIVVTEEGRFHSVERAFVNRVEQLGILAVIFVYALGAEGIIALHGCF